MRTADLEAINRARAERRAVVLATWLKDGRQALVEQEQFSDSGELEQACAKALRSGASGTVEIGGEEVFLHLHQPPPRLVLIGAVHISQALYPMAQATGFEVTVIDPRTAFASKDRFGGVRLLAAWPDEALPTHGLDRFTALASLTHDPKIDDPALIAALNSECFYVGALGSTRTHAKRVERLKDAGIGDDQLDRLHAPVGLDIGARSPAEIAVAVLAEVIAALRLGPASDRA